MADAIILFPPACSAAATAGPQRVTLRISIHQLRGRLTSFHPDVLAQKGRNIEILTFNNGWLAFFEATARGRLELQNFLFSLHRFLRRRRWLFERFFLRRNKARRGSWPFDFWLRLDQWRLFGWNQVF